LENTGSFDSIGMTQQSFFTDREVINDSSYCYKIESFGRYGLSDLPEPLINFSQEVCIVPIDTVAPCLPTLNIRNICNESNPQITDGIFRNRLNWEFTAPECTAAPDLVGFNLYYARQKDDPLVLLEQLNSDEREYLHSTEESFGCYALTTIDEIGNESAFSTTICVEICPAYELPNAFTPNGDGHNDLYIPRQNRFIESIDLKIFNRWGTLVFETKNPNIEWDGRDMNGNEVPDGTYFYTARIFVNGGPVNTDELQPTRNGYIEIVR
jgi:gliding motility-associated-like protein